MATNVRVPKSKFTVIEKNLSLKKKELCARLEEHRVDLFLEREPDDEGAEATRSYSRDLAVINLERERQTLLAINQALISLQKGEYGTCSTCGVEIPQARLRAIPWAKLCVPCAERNASSRPS